MIILGVNGGLHDGSAALVRNGQLVMLVENERVTRSKRALDRSPAPAVHYCLDQAGLTLQDVDVIAVGWNLPAFPDRATESYTDGERDVYYEWLLNPEVPYKAIYGSKRWREQSGSLPAARPPVRFVPHHLAHAAASLWTSGFERAAVIVADGRGEWHSTSVGVGDRSGITFAKTWDITQSLGNFYGFAAEWAGLDFWDAGKLMGLAAYGSPSCQMPLRATVDGYEFHAITGPLEANNQRAEQQRRALRNHFDAHSFPHSAGTSSEIMVYADFAASVQQALEQAFTSLAQLAINHAGVDRLVIGGGVGLNCSLIGALARSGYVGDLYVPPFTHDAGVSVGAALVVASERHDWSPPLRLQDPCLAPGLGSDEIERAVEASQLAAFRLSHDKIARTTAELLADGKTIGWFQGAAEVGQRALGSRSILADPQPRNHVAKLNTMKGREIWRPLAPSVLDEYATDILDGLLPHACTFMLAACPVRPSAQRLVPAAVHVDRTARPQLVCRETNPLFWSVIEEFRRITGVPAVINTSFNLAGEPIVFSAKDALDTYKRSALDALLIGDFLLQRDSTSEGPTVRE